MAVPQKQKRQKNGTNAEFPTWFLWLSSGCVWQLGSLFCRECCNAFCSCNVVMRDDSLKGENWEPLFELTHLFMARAMTALDAPGVQWFLHFPMKMTITWCKYSRQTQIILSWLCWLYHVISISISIIQYPYTSHDIPTKSLVKSPWKIHEEMGPS